MQVEKGIYGDGHKAHPKVPADLRPGRVFVTLDEEIENFQREVRRFRQDEEGLRDEFTPFRLRQGVYGQRQENQQMVRVKLPFGGVSADQMDVLGDIAEKYHLRAYDAIHLTSAIVLKNRLSARVVFASWDAALDVAARQIGLELLPKHPDPF